MKEFKLDLTHIELGGAEFVLAAELAHAVIAGNEIPNTMENFKITHKSIMAGIQLERNLQTMPVKERKELFSEMQKTFKEICKADNKKNMRDLTTTKFTS